MDNSAGGGTIRKVRTMSTKDQETVGNNVQEVRVVEGKLKGQVVKRCNRDMGMAIEYVRSVQLSIQCETDVVAD